MSSIDRNPLPSGMGRLKKITIGKTLDTNNIGFDLDTLVKTRLLIQANSGGGKSYLIRVIGEQAFGKIQTIIIDPEGEFSTLREKYGYVLVGKGGETPADTRSASLLAEKLLEIHASAICDISEIKPREKHVWVKNFLEAMLDVRKTLWHPVLVIVDEAHQYIPEKGHGESEASEAMIRLATQGRKRGFSAVFATQRLGKLRKDAAAELSNVLIGRTWLDIDRQRAADALGIPRKDQHQFFEEVKVLRPGQFWALGIAISTERILINIRDAQTTHPEAGISYKALKPPPTPSQVKALLPKLADLPKQAEEKSMTIKSLQAEIRNLRIELSSEKRKQLQPQKVTEKVTVQDFTLAGSTLKQIVSDIKGSFGRVLSDIETRVSEFEKKAKKVITEKQKPVSTHEVNFPERAPIKQIVSKPDAITLEKKLRAGAERMLAALCQWYPEGMAEGQMRSHAGMKKSGTFATYMTDLRTRGYIEKRDGLLYVTETGLSYFGSDIPKTPTSTEEVISVWTPKLRAGARRILEVAVNHKGEWIDKETLAGLSGMSKSGTFETYLCDLRTTRLIETKPGFVRANKETLFLR